MAENGHPNKPWLVAVWPGMGQVALSAGYYLLAKLGMTAVGEFSSEELFDVHHVNIKDGLIRPAERPRSQLFIWKDPEDRRDILVFIGEAQPPMGKYTFCRRLIEKAVELGVERVFTFAAMATEMHPEHESRVFGASTDGEGLRELQLLELERLNEGQISGLNGVLLSAAIETGLRGTCLLGEIPHLFAQVPYPKASLRVLQVFCTMTGMELDFTELAEHAQHTERQLGEILEQIQQVMHRQSPHENEVVSLESTSTHALSSQDEQRIQQLFDAAAEDRSRAYELKQFLDELGVFNVYEDRFLDLFHSSE